MTGYCRERERERERERARARKSGLEGSLWSDVDKRIMFGRRSGSVSGYQVGRAHLKEGRKRREVVMVVVMMMMMMMMMMVMMVVMMVMTMMVTITVLLLLLYMTESFNLPRHVSTCLTERKGEEHRQTQFLLARSCCRAWRANRTSGARLDNGSATCMNGC